MKITEGKLRMIIRDQLIQESMLRDAWSWIKSKGSLMVEETKEFLLRFKQELEQSAEGTALLAKMATGENLTPDESTFLKNQLVDIGKVIPLLGLIVLPGGSIAVMVLVKLAAKLGVDLLPSSFKTSS